jgi:hypothetical protein
MFEVGQHIVVNGKKMGGILALYLHHGIVSGVENGVCTRVIHYQRGAGETDFSIREESFATFHEGWDADSVRVIEHSCDPIKFSLPEVEMRARSRLGCKEFKYLTNNCESFCQWCFTDVAVSYQARKAGWFTAVCTVVIAAYRSKRG